MTSPAGAATYPIVAIGASAGGIKALQNFFEALPADTGACFVVIVHVDPNSESHLAEVIAQKTSMPVKAVGQSENLDPNTVYVIPPNRRLEITDHEIVTREFDEPRGRRAPIDLFFRSFADHYGDGFAVILSGAGSDGAVGVKAVKERGGLILVQDPNEAEYGSMPRSAIATGAADVVYPIDKLAKELCELIKKKSALRSKTIAESDEESLGQILNFVRARTGHDFSKYKRATLLRRITRRMQLARAEELEHYHEYLREDLTEVDRLFSDLLISVTTFFRDPEAFHALSERVLPRIFENKDADDSIRVWVPGCATGEEAYSLAILLLEEAARRDVRCDIQIFASDLDTAALVSARDGVYPAAIEADVSHKRLQRYFTREGQSYRIIPEVRDRVLFATHSLLKDPPFSRLDLISCRNLLIYLDRELQEQAVSTFNYALMPGGYLFLGTSENADAPQGLFHTIDREARVYQSVEGGGEKFLGLTRLNFSPRPPDASSKRPTPAAHQSENQMHWKALEKHAPPSILVDQAYHIINLSETAGRYLLHPEGPPSSDLVQLVRQELRADLRTALDRAFERREATLSLPIPVRFNGVAQRIYLQVKPFGDESERTALVLFIEGAGLDPADLDNARPTTEEKASNLEIQELRDELQLTRMRLKTSQEEEDATNEELRAANEELQSINEEYRSTAEELETSKEELQSINEELQTLNNELKRKLESVSRAHNDLENLMAATDVGTLFLDRELRIKRFTPRVKDLFNIGHSDVGRLITDFTHVLQYDALPADAREVLKELTPIEREISSSDASSYLMRIRPYRTAHDKIEGIVATFVDITERRKVEEALRESETRLKLAREASDLGVQDYNPTTGECWWDDRARALWDIQAGETVTMDLIWSRIHPDDLSEVRSDFEKALSPTSDGLYEAEFRVRLKDGSDRWIKANGKAFFVGEGVNRRAQRLVATVQDITGQKAWERRQKLLLNELTHRVKNTLAVVQSMARQTFRRASDPEQALKIYEGRILSLAAAHEMLAQNNGMGAELEPLARKQLGAQLNDDGDRFQLEGPEVVLPAHIATPFGLILHELSTNALKHGALSSQTGTVRLNWRLLTPQENESVVEVLWQERGGPKPPENMEDGIGSVLIERSLAGAKVQRDLHEDGLDYKFRIPIDTESAQ